MHYQIKITRNIQEWPLWLLLGSILSLIVSIDVFILFRMPVIKHIPVLVSIFLFFYYMNGRVVIYKTHFSIYFFILLFIISVPGIIFNKISGIETSYFTAIVMILFMVSIILIPNSKINKIKYEDLLKLMFMIGLIFIVSRIIITIIDPLTRAPRHELAFLLPLFISPMILSKDKSKIIIAVILAFLFLIINPRTTVFLVYIITFGIPLLILFINKYGLKYFIYTILLILSLLGIFIVPILHGLSWLDETFKTSLGSSSNADFRQYFLVKGIVEFLKSPIYGSLFAGETAYENKYMSFKLPLHNDILELMVQGGIIGLILFFCGYFGLLFNFIKKYYELLTVLTQETKILIITIFTSMMSAIITFTFNPILNATKTGFILFFIIGVGYIVSRKLQMESTSMIIKEKNE